MQVRAGRRPGVAAVADHLALGDFIAGAHRVAGLVPVTARQSASMIDAGVVAVAAGVGGDDDGPGLGGTHWRALGHGDVDALVHSAPAVAKGRGERATDRPDPPSGRTLDGPGRQRRNARRRCRLLKLLLDLALNIGDVALELVDRRIDLVESRRLRIAGGGEVCLAGLQLGPGANELGLLRLNLVAV